MKIADGGLVGKRCGNLVIAKAADDDSNGQNGTDYIEYFTRHMVVDHNVITGKMKGRSINTKIVIIDRKGV